MLRETSAQTPTKGWRVAFPIIQTVCPPPASLSGNQTVKTFAYFVMTQYIDNKGNCAVTNNDELSEEGRAQQEKAGAQRDVARHEAEAEKSRAEAEAHEAEQRSHQ